MPSTIYFTNLSVGAIKSYNWNFGNGTSSSFSNPSVVYTQAGSYTVELEVTDSGGLTSTYSKTIRIFKKPKVSFTVDKSKLCEQLPLQFTNTTIVGDTGIASWLWDLGDGNYSVYKDPPHVYTNHGFYTVKLVATDHHGCVSDTSIVNMVEVKDRPKAAFYFDENRSCKAPISVYFSNLTNHANTSYLWKFSDGDSSSATNPTHVFNSMGQHSVTLIATHANGCKDTLTKSGGIEIAPLTADFTIPNKVLCLGDTVTLKEAIKPRLTTPTVYAWLMPDGSTRLLDSVNFPLKNASQNIKLTVTNSKCSAVVTKTLLAQLPPQKQVNFSTKKLCGNQSSVQFSLDTVGLDSFVWRIDNKYNRTTKSSTEIFNVEGPHYIQLYVRGHNGCVARYTDTVYRSNPRINGTKDTGACVPFTFKPHVTLSGFYGLDSLRWDLTDFGLGTYQASQLPYITLSDTGYKYVDFEITDSIGCVFNESWQVGGGYKPQASFTSDKDSVCNGESLVLINTSTSPNYPTDFYWDLGPTTGYVKNWAPKIKIVPGFHDVRHVVSHYGCNDTLFRAEYIYVKGPYADIGIATDSCISSYKNIYGLIFEADSFHYDLNGEYFRTDTNFQYSFQNADRLKLIAFNVNGCVDSSEHLIEVVGNAVLDWDVSAGSCAPSTIEVTRMVENLDSFKWYINGKDLQHKELKLATTMYTGGDINIQLKGFAGDGCNITLDTTISVEGPKLKTYVSQTFGCMPKTFTLIDSLWTNVGERYWIVDGDTVPSNGISTNFTLNGVKDPTSRIVTIFLIAKEGECYAKKQLNYQLPGVEFNSHYDDSIVDCTHSRYTFGIVPNSFKLDKVLNYTFSHQGVSLTNTSGKFQKVLELNESTDSIYLSVNTIDGCRFTQLLILPKPGPAVHAEFTANPTESMCPPTFVSFEDVSGSKLGKIVERNWSINGTYFSELINPTRLFNLPGYYNVRLVVKDERGCEDSVQIDSFIRIEGAKVDADFGSSENCFGDKIKCKIISGNAMTYEWDMGDGNVINSDSFEYVYASPGVHRIQLLVSDSNQCKYAFYNVDSTWIYELPKAAVKALNQCSGSWLELRDVSTTPHTLSSRNWEIDGISRTEKADSLFYLAGLDDIEVSLWLEDENACRDSITTIFKVYDQQVDFSMNKAFYCLNDTILLSSAIISDTVNVSTQYYLNNKPFNALFDTSFLAGNAGEFELVLVSTDAMGCKDTSGIKNLKVAGPATSNPLTIYYATFIENNAINLMHSKAGIDYFKSYQLFNENNQLLSEKTGRDWQNFIIQTDGNQRKVHCFKVGAYNGCYALDPDQLDMHCTIHTTGESTSMSKTLRWTPYVGWNVKSYSIDRLDNGSWHRIAVVGPDVFSYVDTDLSNCSGKDVYRVIASSNSLYFSISDTVHIKPLLDYPLSNTLIRNIDVLGNDRIELVFDSSVSQLIPRKLYRISKGSEIIETTSSNYIDSNVNTQLSSYAYQVSQLDQCDRESDWSDPAQSILLSVENSPTSIYPVLRWNRSLLWENEIHYYSIQRITDDGATEIKRIYDVLDTTYVDEVINLGCATSTCYKIVAHSSDGKWLSNSNINCGGMYSTLFAPNGVTPNGDLLNDQFHPVGLFIDQYELRIYNRWGEMVYKTNECLGGWDCSIDGEAAPASTYFYSIQAIGADGKAHNLSGSLNILK